MLKVQTHFLATPDLLFIELHFSWVISMLLNLGSKQSLHININKGLEGSIS